MNPAIFCILFALAAGAACAQAPTATEPEELKKLRENWQRARQQAEAPVDKRYLDSLQELKARFVRAGTLTQALAVDAEIKKLTPEVPSSNPATTPVNPGKWQITTEVLTAGPWTFEMGANGKQTYIFTADHRMSIKGYQLEGTWKVTGGTLRVEPGRHWTELIVDTSAGDGVKRLKEINSDSGKRKDYSLTLQQK